MEGITLIGQHVHHEDPDFPVVAPDVWKNSDDAYVDLGLDPEERRAYYQEQLRIHRASSGNTFRTNCKHQVSGNMYRQVPGQFYIPEGIDQPRDVVHKAIITVLDKNGEPVMEKGREKTSTIEFAYTPLYSRGNHSNAGKELQKHAQLVQPAKDNDCRTAPMGHMAATGCRVYLGENIVYKGTPPDQSELTKKMHRFFRDHGFLPRLIELKTAMCNAGAQSCAPGTGPFPFFTLCVVSTNYGNECHIDPMDGKHGQGITIWHEHRYRPTRVQNRNWYFLFPDARIKGPDGKWHKGLAIPLIGKST